MSLLGQRRMDGSFGAQLCVRDQRPIRTQFAGQVDALHAGLPWLRVTDSQWTMQQHPVGSPQPEPLRLPIYPQVISLTAVEHLVCK
jgi:hypothetical protein